MLLLVNVDDITNELLPYIIEGLMERGAANAHVTQALTKKGRLGYLLFIDTPAEQIETLGGFLVAELGTIGMRVFETRHIHFDYRTRQMRLTVPTEQGTVQVTIRVKEVYNKAGHVVSIKAEYDDLQTALAQFHQAGMTISFTALKRLVEQQALEQGTEPELYQTIQIETIREDEK